MSNEKILDLLKKLKALSDRGVGGEKENAAAKLKELMSKHNISLDDIEVDVRKERHFKVSTAKARFLKQVIASVIGNRYKYQRAGRTEFWFDLTDSEFIEVNWKMDFYWTKYEEDAEIFYSAFIQKNKLFAKPTEEKDENDKKEMTPEEKERLYRMFQMMEGLQKHNPLKRIEASK